MYLIANDLLGFESEIGGGIYSPIQLNTPETFSQITTARKILSNYFWKFLVYKSSFTLSTMKSPDGISYASESCFPSFFLFVLFCFQTLLIRGEFQFLTGELSVCLSCFPNRKWAEVSGILAFLHTLIESLMRKMVISYSFPNSLPPPG